MNNLLIGDFEGPLDLLLHLIKKEKKDIFEISIEEITEKYLNYIKEMKDMNLDIASEYLVMATELIELKSRSLLPIEKQETTDEEEINPEDELRRRLLEYQKYKESKETFKDLREKRNNYFTKPPERSALYSNKPLTNSGNVTTSDLLNALQKLIERKSHEKPLNTKVATKEISVKERVASIRNVLKKNKRVTFLSLFEVLDKPFVIVTFLSVLEMAKNGEINLLQENNFSEIYLERVD